MIAAGALLLLRKPSPPGRRKLPGAALVLTSFLLRTAEAFDRVPARYDWEWFLAGWLLSVLGLLWFLRPGAASQKGYGEDPRVAGR